jgi:Polyphosphate kinase 2 (PPK2)
MFAATDTEVSPCNVVNAADPRRARLNCITHLPSKIPYEEIPREKIKLGERQPARGTWSRRGAVAMRRGGGQLVATGRLPMQGILAALDATAEYDK